MASTKLNKCKEGHATTQTRSADALISADPDTLKRAIISAMYKFEKGKTQKKQVSEDDIKDVSSPATRRNGRGNISYFCGARDITFHGNVFMTTEMGVTRSPFSGITLVDWFGREYYLDVHFTVSYEVWFRLQNRVPDPDKRCRYSQTHWPYSGMVPQGKTDH